MTYPARLQVVLLLCAVLLPLPALAGIEYTGQQAETAVEIVDALERRHYSKRRFDDQLSSLLLDNYLLNLDSARMFFLQGDIEEFERYRLRLDDQFGDGNLKAGFVIFDRFQQRMEKRLQKLLQRLPEIIAGMDFSIDENLLLDPDQRGWAGSEAAMDEHWRKQLKNAVLSLKLAGKEAADIEPTLRKRYENQLHRISQYNAGDVFQFYANALTELYDPHTTYLSPRNLENFNISMSLSLEGIGAVLQLQDEYTKVARIVPAGPADKQGQLRPADRIVAVGQEQEGEMVDIIGWRLDDVVQLIRGPKDSTVRLEVIPANARSPDQRNTITIVRNRVKLEEQSARKQVMDVMDNGRRIKLGVIEIPAFYIDFEALRRGDEGYKSTTRDVKRLLDQLAAEAVDGVIIDLRNNGGGSLQEANALTGLFIEYGPTVQIRHASHRLSRQGKRRPGPYYAGPLVVLINRLSASASEIFAGAIQDYQRGIILGGQSFGKGTVQTLLPMPEGQLKVTESKFYRISGASTQHRGVIPDLLFPSPFDRDEIGESALDHALDWDRINGVRHRKYHDLPGILPQLLSRHEQRTRDDPDFIHLRERIALAEVAREMDVLPLNKATRQALQESQQASSMAIENKRRAAKGLELLTSLTDASENTLADTAVEDPDEEETPDIVLVESSKILVDLLNNGEQFLASSF
ncbi:MAG: carboxy terminal-processing peptidase [Halieaceae bacterium]|nr:carboxy terminal-processing peptidase [Halieaceae bacterium]